jgi:hypothetical protein
VIDFVHVLSPQKLGARAREAITNYLMRDIIIQVPVSRASLRVKVASESRLRVFKSGLGCYTSIEEFIAILEVI